MSTLEVTTLPNNFKPEAPRISDEEFTLRIAPYGHKLKWFLDQGYVPHYRQMLFHTMREEGEQRLCRFRHLVAGRRGGKTLSAAWDVLYYLLHPEMFHLDAHNASSSRPLHVWVLTADYPLGRPAWRTFEEVLRQAGLELGPDYKRNLGDKFFEFTNGSMIEFKTADNPESLRGAGLDLLWMDEAAFIPTKDAYSVTRPALSDKLGLVISTTTPHGKNWFYKEFWSPEALASPRHGRVEYWSIQNPYFDKEEWEEVKLTYHPLLFRSEFMASFDSMAGIELRGDWLQYYTLDLIPRKADNPGIMDIQTYLGVDPAISLSDDADRFAMILLGVDKKGQGYLLEEFADRIPFPEQVEKVMDWMHKYKPSLIGIESNAYQAALEQQLRMVSPVAPFVPVMSKGKKAERILRMAPVFRTGAVKLRETHYNFINEWIDYDSTKKNSNDDVLDAMDIALGLAGALLPELPKIKDFDPDRPSGDIDELARRSRPGGDLYGPTKTFDEMFGEDF